VLGIRNQGVGSEIRLNIFINYGYSLCQFVILSNTTPNIGLIDFGKGMSRTGN